MFELLRHQHLLNLFLGDFVLDELRRLEGLRGSARDLDATLAEPLLEDRRARAEKVDLVQTESADPLIHVVLSGSHQGQVLGEQCILAEDDPKHVLTPFHLLFRYKKPFKQIEWELTVGVTVTTTKSFRGLKFWGTRSDSDFSFSLVK